MQFSYVVYQPFLHLFNIYSILFNILCGYAKSSSQTVLLSILLRVD